jgi:hypothetical protein
LPRDLVALLTGIAVTLTGWLYVDDGLAGRSAGAASATPLSVLTGLDDGRERRLSARPVEFRRSRRYLRALEPGRVVVTMTEVRITRVTEQPHAWPTPYHAERS